MFDFEEVMKAISETKWSENDTGYLLSSSFMKDFEESAKKKLPPGKINNRDLKPKNRWKPNMKQNIDYFVVREEVYDDLVMAYEGGPKISCTFDELGNPFLYPTEFVFIHDSKERKFRVSRYTTFDQIDSILRSYFEIPENLSFKVLSDKKPIDVTDKSVISSLPGTRFELKVDKPKVVKDKKTTKGEAPHRVTGLKNLGNSCYMNASLQSLLCLPRFIDSLADKTGPVTECFRALVDSLHRNKASWEPKAFKQMIGQKIPFFDNTSQQDAQEFTSFFIDMLHEENRDVLDKAFYGKDTSKTTCVKCNSDSSVNESFTILSLPISGSRRIVYSPWNLSEPMQRITVVPDFPVVMVGRSKHDPSGLVETTTTTGYKEVIAFELPSCFAEEENQGLAIVELKSNGKEICKPVLMRADLNTDVDKIDIEIRLWNRIQELWEPGDARKNAKKFIRLVDFPQRFTLRKGSFLCNERIVVDVVSPYGERSCGFTNTRNRIVSSVISLDELIQSFFSKFQLDPKNKWRCDKCGEETCAFHQTFLHTLPENLIIQLKRFSRGNRFQRDDTVVSIPQKIDLSGMFESPREGSVYHLMAMTNHIGTLDAGHYTAVGKRGNQWYTFNDSNVTERDGPIAQGEAPYILYFAREF